VGASFKRARLVLASTVLGFVSGCIGPSARELHEAAESLVPSGSEIVAQVEADCVELARSPSCVEVYFIPKARSRDERVAAVEQAARAAGWQIVRKETFIGGSELRFRRGGLQAFVHLFPDERLERCREAAARECADTLSVEPS
jgi:hypothetical protein